MSKAVPLKAVMSEKAYAFSQKLNTYVFVVPRASSKPAVKRAIEDQYEVGVKSVQVANIAGKAKKTYRRRGRSVPGKRADVRKAYVTLAEGDSLPIFAAVQAAEESEKEKK